MKISQIYVYPIKSLRAVSLAKAEITRKGFQYDRRFMLLRVHPGHLKNMHIVQFPEMALFRQELELPDFDQNTQGKIRVTYCSPDRCDNPTLEIPLCPEVSTLAKIEVSMHQSSTVAYDMGECYNAWFSKYFEFEVVLAYIGTNSRKVLGNLSPSVRNSGWLSGISQTVSQFGSRKSSEINFQDCAPFLVVTKASLDNVSARLCAGVDMDVTKFRPNIVLESPELDAFDEDFWGEITFEKESKLILTANCTRCKSINVDYTTGKVAQGDAGVVLKKLMGDRRVDSGAKYSPVFGRYGFPSDDAIGISLQVGDSVEVTKVNADRTRFEWPGLGN